MKTIKLNLISRSLAISGRAVAALTNHLVMQPANYMFVAARTFLFGNYFDFDISERSAEASVLRLQQYYTTSKSEKSTMLNRLEDMNSARKGAPYAKAVDFLEQNTKNGILDVVNLYWQACDYMGDVSVLAKTLNKFHLAQKTGVKNVDLAYVKKELAKQFSLLDPEIIYFAKNNAANRSYLYKFEADTLRIKREVEKDRALKKRIKEEGVIGWIFRNTIEAAYNKVVSALWAVVDTVMFLPRRIANGISFGFEKGFELSSTIIVSVPKFVFNTITDGIMNLAGLADNVINSAVTLAVNGVISGVTSVFMFPVNYVKSLVFAQVPAVEQPAPEVEEELPAAAALKGKATEKRVRFVDEVEEHSIPMPEVTATVTPGFLKHKTMMEADRAAEAAETQNILVEETPALARTRIASMVL